MVLLRPGCRRASSPFCLLAVSNAVGCFAEMLWRIGGMRLRCTKSCVPILGAVAGLHLLDSKHLVKWLEASFAAIDLFRLRCAPLTLSILVERLQLFLSTILREHFHQSRSHQSCSFCVNRTTVIDAYNSVGFESRRRFCHLHLMVSILQPIPTYWCFHSPLISSRSTS